MQLDPKVPFHAAPKHIPFVIDLVDLVEILVQSFLDHDRVLLRGLILFAVVAYHHSSYDKNAHDQE